MGTWILFIQETFPLSFIYCPDEKCWEKDDTIHGIKLKRRVVAKKVIEPHSCKGTSNLLEDFYCYQIACWCCFEEDMVVLFEHFKQKHKVKGDDLDTLKEVN